jgi:hypothetical protein
MRDDAVVGSSAEARWFVAGDIPAELRPSPPARRRVDSYCVPSLSPVSSLKRRGDRRSLELKVRVGRVELVRYGAAIGFAERWLKRQLDAASRAVTGPWLDVNKQIWSIDGGEVARLSVAGTRWWTVAALTAAGALPDPTQLLAWTDAASAGGKAHSYASWLTELCRHPSTRDAVA